ncbi:DsrE/DsrF/DrsH-like family protein [Dehalobacter sp. DCM]|uniref:DsrE/DsrF/DrsH-like family protein n=1 Tax=Dehalobacter sp. DCM TaxID=2907827 RepID=UPI0030817ABF|nr:DsrE/DsrF/DrsH-like family protein [Dehalobacter sp. DCM]
MEKGKKLSLILFSGDYDKAMAALILANSARELGMTVNIFFAFWGLCLIRDPEKMSLEDKTAFETMFGIAAPNGPEDLPLSRMNMAGLGKAMLKKMMAEHDAPDLTAFLKGAQKKGVNFFICKLSLEIMGFKKEEMIQGSQVLTATEYLQDALDADIELFI